MGKKRTGDDKVPEEAAPPDELASPVVYEDWDWWPCDEDRRSAAEKEFSKLPPQVRKEFLDRIDRLLDGKTRGKEVKDVGDGILELKCRTGNNEFRILYFVEERVCIGLTCFYKNSQKLEKGDLDRARERRKKFMADKRARQRRRR